MISRTTLELRPIGRPWLQRTPEDMIKKILLAVASLTVVLVAFAYIMYLRNITPIVPVISSAEAANPSKPYVVKLHAQWCPVCMLTKPVWSQIVATYSMRANLVVFDFTNQATTDTSRAEASDSDLKSSSMKMLAGPARLRFWTVAPRKW